MFAPLALPEQRIHAELHELRIGSLHVQRPDYDNYAEYQRDKVWPYTMKRGLIDTILHELPMPPLFAVKKDRKFWIVDGQQRLSTILEYLADGFATSRLREDPALSLVEPNKRFSQLSPDAQEIINDYTIQVWVIDERDEASLGALFRRLQQQQPLNLAERLWTYRNEARTQVSTLMEHPFWREIYIGKLTRKRPFLGSLYLLLVELDNGYTSITPPSLRDIATGAREGSLASELIETVWQRLDSMRHLFHGTMVLPMGEVIPLYQAVLFLEKSECDPKKSEEGCLSPWYRDVKEASLQARRTPGQIDLLAKITSSKHQLEFWSYELPKMLAAKGLYKINKKRVFNASDRLLAWERQKGICPVCHQPVKPTDQGHHVIHYKKGGPTTPENCMIVHEECHIRIHEMTGVEPDIIPVESDHA